MKQIFVIIFSFFALSLTLLSQSDAQYTVILPNSSRVKITALRLHDRDYVSFRTLSSSVFKNSMISADGSEISFGDEKLRTAPAAFFLVRENSDGSRIAQLPYPSLIISNQLFVPLLPFCTALEWTGIYHVEIQGRTITLSEFPKNQPTFAELIESETYIRKKEKQAQKAEESVAAKADEEPNKQDEEADEPEEINIAGNSRNMPKAMRGLKPLRTILLTHSLDIWQPGSRAEISRKLRGQYDSQVGGKSQRRETEPEKRTEIAPRIPSKPDEMRPLTPPNRYVMPSDLYRRELEEDDSPGNSEPSEPPSGSFNDETGTKSNFHLADYRFPVLSQDFAGNLTEIELSNTDIQPVRIQKIEVCKREENIEITITADSAIHSFQRPETMENLLMLRFPNADNAFSGLDSLPVKSGFPFFVLSQKIRGILVYQFGFPITIERCSYRREGVNSLVFTVIPKNSDEETSGVTAISGGSKKLSKESQKWALDVIVIDAGHGGKDPGTIGVSGVKEKDVTLAIAKKLGEFIRKNMPQTKVVFTRDDDRFVELYRRGQIANEQGGKLFISIHCNSMPTKPSPSNGCETYILRPGRNDDAVRVANRENAAVKFENNQGQYKELTKEQFIVVNMAQSAFVKFSEQFATMIEQEVSKNTKMVNRGVSQAGFFVLVGASMPNVLFETGFLSNTNEEKILASAKGQENIAKGMFQAVKRYAEKYRQMLEKR